MKSTNNPLEPLLKKSERKIVYLGTACGILLFIVIALLGKTFITSRHKENPTSLQRINPNAPFQSEVQKIIDPLVYSFLPILERSDVRLKLDFKNRLWVLENIHLIDEQGKVSLEDNRFGICGDLAAYTYQHVKPILEPRYKVQFVRAAESHFFPAPLNSHFVLSVTDTQNPDRIFILDPSFKRYGPLQEFNDYLFFENISFLGFMAQKSRNHIELINRAAPMLIRGDIKMSLIVTPEADQFNPENFAICILATERNTYIPKSIYKVGMREGKQIEEVDAESKRKLDQYAEYTHLIKAVNRFFDAIVRRH